jgi:hypothetical protein
MLLILSRVLSRLLQETVVWYHMALTISSAFYLLQYWCSADSFLFKTDPDQYHSSKTWRKRHSLNVFSRVSTWMRRLRATGITQATKKNGSSGYASDVYLESTGSKLTPKHGQHWVNTCRSLLSRTPYNLINWYQHFRGAYSQWRNETVW